MNKTPGAGLTSPEVRKMLKIYKETKLDIRPSTADSVVSISVPSSADSAPPRGARFSVQAKAPHEDVTKDEDAFAKRYLATQGSVYFRQRRCYPRSFLWRVVGDDRTLELRSVDLTKSTHEAHEAHLTLRLEFQDAILPHGVALADPEDHEALSVFVITGSRQLYTFTLRPEFFRRAASIDENIADWCKIFRPAPLNFAYPHRLYASSPLELLVSLDNGALLRLTRRGGDDGTNWSAITLDEKTWGASLRGLVGWSGHQSIKYDGRTLDPHTPNAVAVTSDGIFAFVVSLDHKLKVWNLHRHMLVASKDLLNRTSQQQEASRHTLNPAESAFIRIFNAERATEGGLHYVATYSPHDDGQFKFWAVRGGLTAGMVVEDMFPNAKLMPVDPDDTGSVFWNVVDFQVKPADEGRGMALWVLWRSNTQYQLDTLHFDLQNLEDVWDSNWTTTALELRTDEPPPVFMQADVVGPTEKWLEYLFSPERFTPEVIVTSLAIYQDVMKYRPSPRLSERPKSLKQRVSSTIVDSVALRKLPDAHMDFERYSRDLDARWRQFWHIAQDINKRRNEAISLAYDTYSDVPWLVLADGSALVRECSGTELLLHNEGRPIRESRHAIGDCWPHRNLKMELGEQPEELCRLLAVAASFRQNLTPEILQACRVAFNSELFAEPSLSAPERVVAFHGRCGFADLMSDDLFDSVYTSVDRAVGLKKLCNDQFFAIVDTLPLGFPGKDSDLLSTEVGRNATVRGAMETIWLSRQILRDLILLSVFVESEVATEERTRFDGVEVFATLIDLLREYEMMNWLGSTVREWPDKALPETAAAKSTSSSVGKGSEERRISTILEDLFAVHIKPRPAVGTSQMYVLTQQIRDVISWITRQGEVTLPNVLVFIQCDLIACGNIDLASAFLPFQPNTAWSTYVKGRLYVTKSEFDVAAIYFQKAAYVLSSGKAVGNLHEMSSNLVDLVCVNYFYNGLPKYFQHIVGVFEQARAFTHVSDFARLALQALESSPKKSEDYVSARTDLLSRLFHASMKTCRFDEAYSALSRYSDPALQKSALTSLITTILTASGPGNAGLQRILRFPLSLTGDLSSHVNEVLASLAKKQLHTSSSLSQAVPISGWQDPATVPDYNHVLQAYRIARNDFRGAAEVAYQIVCRIREARDEPPMNGIRRKVDTPVDVDEEDDLESRELRNELLALINLLACMEKNEAYILVEQGQQRELEHGAEKRGGSIPGQNGGVITTPEGSKPAADYLRNGAHAGPSPSQSNPASPNNMSTTITTAAAPIRRKSTSSDRRDSISSLNAQGVSSGAEGDLTKFPKRVVITLDDLRREYQAELDRVSRLQRGNWEFGVTRRNKEDAENDLDMDIDAQEDSRAGERDVVMAAE